MEEPVSPVELGNPADQVMHEQEGDLGVADLVQGAEGGGGAPGAVATEARGAEIPDDRGEFGKGQGGGVQLERIDPGWIEGLEVLDPAYGLADRLDGELLVMLMDDVFGIRRAVRLIPVLPLGMGQPGGAADGFREDVPRVDVGIVPVEFAAEVQPLIPFQHRRESLQTPRCVAISVPTSLIPGRHALRWALNDSITV